MNVNDKKDKEKGLFVSNYRKVKIKHQQIRKTSNKFLH